MASWKFDDTVPVSIQLTRLVPTRSIPPPLSDVLLASARCLRAVSSGRSLSDALPGIQPLLRPAAQAVSFHVMRRLGLAREVRRILVRRAPAADALLLTSLALLDTALEYGARPAEGVAPREVPLYTVPTVVDQAVNAAGACDASRSCKALFNAVLRRFAREWTAIVARARKNAEARWNYPKWWIQCVHDAYPACWRELLEAGNRPAPMMLRVNPRRSSVGELLAQLRAANLAARPLGRQGIVLDTPRPVHAVPGFDQGWWSVQDVSAQRAGALVAPVAGMRVLDACAAPGGKSAHLLELADIELVALDNDAARLRRMRANLDRLGLMSDAVSLRHADAADPAAWWDGRAFDVVLADVPCTASGIVRRHPDIRWLREPGDVAATASRQAHIVDALWRVVRPGGRLVYATCSLFPAEGGEQAARFLECHGDAERLPAPGQLLPTGIADAGDGFFYAVFARRERGGQK
ncbi:MAG: 16S rRNA (cytosine(967)-C(5))-methyltransferase RsmB [Candidimonas sp.]|nr:MAG: 16S rRNA (cytosine(967)-C(5))-methyltransferase RsmB [Candidimonas sp.]